MSDIAKLQEAVETARAAYARASEQHSSSCKHAMSLIHIIEEQLREKRIELSQNDVKRERMIREYGQLRQMLHALVMDVEVGGTAARRSGPTAIEAGPQVVTPLAPVPVASEPREPSAEAARRKPAKAGTAKGGADVEEPRAGWKRMLKKKRTPAAELDTVKTDETEAPTPAE